MAFSSIGKVNLTEIYDFHLDPRLHHEIRKKQPLADLGDRTNEHHLTISPVSLTIE